MARALNLAQPYRDPETGRLQFVTWHRELGAVVAFPVRDQGKLVVAGRSAVPDDYDLGWFPHYCYREEEFNAKRLLTYNLDGDSSVDCWPESLNTTLFSSWGIGYYNFVPGSPGGYASNFIYYGALTLTRQAIIQTSHTAFVRYINTRRTLVENPNFGGIQHDYTVKHYVDFFYRDSAFPCKIAAEALGHDPGDDAFLCGRALDFNMTDQPLIYNPNTVAVMWVDINGYTKVKDNDNNTVLLPFSGTHFPSCVYGCATFPYSTMTDYAFYLLTDLSTPLGDDFRYRRISKWFKPPPNATTYWEHCNPYFPGDPKAEFPPCPFPAIKGRFATVNNQKVGDPDFPAGSVTGYSQLLIEP